jgi:hypothetical protein
MLNVGHGLNSDLMYDIDTCGTIVIIATTSFIAKAILLENYSNEHCYLAGSVKCIEGAHNSVCSYIDTDINKFDY